ncbi:MAG: NAD(P)-dependent oxidoreductase [Acidimicrobiia bacterium]|nr:NAD(P)-dependent oxidoreductase [Acidimicrobiia bacterium]
MRVAVIGLGRMGGPIADHIIRAGHDVRVFDVDPARCEPRVALGAVACTSPGDAARGVEMISIIVFDDEQLFEVLLADDGIINTVDEGVVIAVHTTTTIETLRDVAIAASVRNADVLDAGISGGEVGATSGTLLLLVGGHEETVERARPVLDTFSKEVVHAGPRGTGMALKLARNAIGYGWMTVVADATAMAVAAGVDPALVRHAVAETGVLDQALVPLGLGGPGPWAADDPARSIFEHVADLADKDLHHAQALAAELDTTVPMLDATRRTFRRAVRLDD